MQMSKMRRAIHKITIKDRSFKGSVRLNRSRKWRAAKTYQEARDYSPSGEHVR